MPLLDHADDIVIDQKPDPAGNDKDHSHAVEGYVELIVF